MGMLVDGEWLADDERYRRSNDGAFVRPASSCAAQSGRNHSARTGAGFQRASQARDRIFVARRRRIEGNMERGLKREGGKLSEWDFNLWKQVLAAMVLGVLAGWLFPPIIAAL